MEGGEKGPGGRVARVRSGSAFLGMRRGTRAQWLSLFKHAPAARGKHGAEGREDWSN